MTTQPLIRSTIQPLVRLIRPATRLLLPALGALVLAPAVASASEPVSSQPSSTGTSTSAEATTSTGPTTSTDTTTTSTPAPEAPVATPPATTTEPVPSSPGQGAPVETTTPRVRTQHAQGSTPGGSVHASHAHKKSHSPTGGEGEEQEQASENVSPAVGAKHRAPAPSALTPPLPLTLGGPISGVSSFFIESFSVPPFLLPIYQAAGTAYGIPWQVLAAINEVETDYGRDLSVSSAGAEGWMQFLPAEWAQYGVDANGDGFKDPYNPADAIFTAARYLKAAGGDTDIRGAVYSYNHSQAYVDSVMLRAQLLGGTPPELLGAVTGLTEARFPVHAQSHFSDGFATVAASGTGTSQTLVGTTIYASVGAPVIAVQDGEIVGSGVTPSLGRYVSLRDAYGNTYTYAELGGVATLYPVLEPLENTAVSPRIAQSSPSGEPAPSGPASAGAQSRSPLSEGAAESALALGAAAGLEAPAAGAGGVPIPPPVTSAPPAASSPASTPRMFRAGSEDVYLHPLSVGVQVLAGTVLGHIGPGASVGSGTSEPHMLFQIRPAGAGAPLIDPKPILDGWVQLENTSIFRAKGQNPFLGNSPTVGQVLLESKEQLEQQVLSDPGIHLPACGRQDVQTGQVDRRVLATLEFLSVSGLRPTVSSLQCSHVPAASAANAAETSAGDAVEIVAVNGIAIAGHQGPGSIADITIRKLLTLQGTMKPRQIISLMSYPGTDNTLAVPGHGEGIHVEFAPLSGAAPTAGEARSASAFSAAITPGQWIQLIARLGEIPDPKVGSGPSAASIPDHPGSSSTASPPAPATSAPSTSSSTDSSTGSSTGSSSTGAPSEDKETGSNG
jgi:murein DD-endopeptidase MepM/ murein hydrolase activator NlpD